MVSELCEYGAREGALLDPALSLVYAWHGCE